MNHNMSHNMNMTTMSPTHGGSHGHGGGDMAMGHGMMMVSWFTFRKCFYLLKEMTVQTPVTNLAIIVCIQTVHQLEKLAKILKLPWSKTIDVKCISYRSLVTPAHLSSISWFDWHL